MALYGAEHKLTGHYGGIVASRQRVCPNQTHVNPLSISQNIQYVAYPATVHPVQFGVATVGTRYSSELLILKVQEPRQA